MIAGGAGAPVLIPNTEPFRCTVARNEFRGRVIQDSSTAVKFSHLCIGNNRAISTRGINVGTLAFDL